MDQIELLLKEYHLETQGSLTNFQFIEELLKIYLSYALRIVKISTITTLSFKPLSLKQIYKKPLGKLINEFKIYNGNKELIKKLEGIIDKRNYCAHQSYLMTIEQQKNEKYLKSEIFKMKKIYKNSQECFYKIGVECKKIEKILKKIS